MDWIWADACCVCKWPIWTSMTGEHNGRDCHAVGWKGSECHPWCAPYRTPAMMTAPPH